MMTHLPPLIADLSLILVTAGLTTLIFKKIKQPVVLGYILAGFLVGPYNTLIPSVTGGEDVQTWSEIGVIFLLFSLGLEFSFKKLIKIGGSAGITAVVEIVIMIAVGFVAGKLMGWSSMDSLFLGAILSMSSTTIIIRAFDELGMKTKKFAGLVFGILIAEDLIAILLMVLLSTLAISKEFAGGELGAQLFKLLFFLIAWFVAGIFFIPTLLKRTRRLMNDETLLIVSLGLCLLMVVLSVNVGFSAALGAFVMGSIFAETTSVERIEHLIQPVKDLFGAIFFVSVGMMIDPSVLVDHAKPVIIVTLLTIFGKFFASASGAILSGQPLKQSVQAGLSLAQIGEFSFIIAALGVSLKVTSEFLYPITVAASVVTTLTTPFLIKNSEWFYFLIERKLPKRWINFLNRYSSGSQQIAAYSEWKGLIRSYFRNIAIQTVVIMGIILLSKELLYPLTLKLLGTGLGGTVAITLVTLLLVTAPLWALTVRKINSPAFTNLWMTRSINRTPLIGLELFRIALAMVLMGFLFETFFSTPVTLFITLPIIAVIILIFSKPLQTIYTRAEKRFITNLNEREHEKARYNAMAPWDAHMANFSVGPDMGFIGKSLMELGWREKYGVNIALIERGRQTVVSPNREEKLYPGDLIRVIGTDEQLAAFQELFVMNGTAEEENDRPEVVLKNIPVTERCALYNRSINSLTQQEKADILIVGLERNGERILNPDSGMLIEPDDVLWAIGTKERLRQFINANGSGNMEPATSEVRPGRVQDI